MPRTQLSRTPLSKQAGVLRTSLLLSLGLSPLACGGSTGTGSNAEGGGSAQAGAGDVAGAPSSGGASSHAGAASHAGAPSFSGGPSHAGAPSFGGAPPHAGAPSFGGAPSHAGAGGTGPVACEQPVLNPVTKLVTCKNGLQHRPEALACSFTLPPPPTGGAGGGGGTGGLPSQCDADDDCRSLHYGYCDFSGGNAIPTCKAGCAMDSECSSGICACSSTGPGHCTAAGCVTDADCGSNSLCALTFGICGPGSFQCTTPQDQCITNADCGGGTCTFNGTHRACNGAVCGRPFLVAESPRMAEIETRVDWLDVTLVPNSRGLTPVQRAQLAAHWAHLGQMEHASIAAFARFQLQLLSLGAPSDLVEACNRALADETAHTRACFALASAYGGISVGPTRLDIERCFEDTSLGAIAKLVLREGCLGETVASLEALAAAEVVSDPAVKRALMRIAHDELNHAELAFKFLRWALTQTPAEVRYELAREAAQRLADFESDARHRERTRTDDQLAAHGLIGSDALAAIHLAAVRDVTRPLLAALFELENSNDA